MPKAPRKATSQKTEPYSAKAGNKSKATPDPKPKPTTKPKDPKASHLYTDDNPSTTLHGTGFKDASAAHRTLSLIAARSLTYQWQTVNTMYHRAAHHPSMKRAGADTSGMQEAMGIFRAWLDETYPAQKGKLRGGGFKPLLGREVVERYVARIMGEVEGEGRTFAGVYVGLGKGKRLANVLVDEAQPGGRDWEVARYEALDGLVGEGKEVAKKWEYDELWTKDDEGRRVVTQKHLSLIAWAWSPVSGKELLK